MAATQADRAPVVRAASTGGPTDRAVVSGELAGEVVRFLRLLKNAAPEPGLDRSALMLLSPLLDGPMRLRDLAAARGADPSTVSRQVAELVRAGLVSSEADAADRRARRLAVTEAGRAACRRMIEARAAAITEALDTWSDRQLAGFVHSFRELNARIEAYQQGRQAGTEPPAAAVAAVPRQEPS
jgi:DNA-binding MarR family transcriptional regulator